MPTASFLPHPASTQFFHGGNPGGSRCPHLGITPSSACTMAWRAAPTRTCLYGPCALFASASQLPARSLFLRAVELPPYPSSADKQEVRTQNSATPGFSDLLPRTIPDSGTKAKLGLPLPFQLSEVGDSRTAPSWVRPIRLTSHSLIGHLRGAGR